MTDSPSLTKDLARGVQFHMEPTDDAELRVQAYDTADGHRAIYSAKHPRDWYTKQQTRRTIANTIVENVPDGVDSDEVRGALQDLFTDLDAKSEEVKKKLQPPDVAHVLNNTQAVKVYGGEDAQFLVDLKINGRETTIEFTAGEWANDSPGPLKTQYANAYYEVLELDADQWREIRQSWQEDLEEVSREEQTTEDMVAAQLLEKLRKRRVPVDEKSMVTNDVNAALWDAPSEERAEDDDRGRQIRTGEVPNDETVLWVRSQAVVSVLDDLGRGEEYTARLSRTLQEHSDIFASSTRHRIDGDRMYLYPFNPDALNVGFLDVHESDDSEEVEP